MDLKGLHSFIIPRSLSAGSTFRSPPHQNSKAVLFAFRVRPVRTVNLTGWYEILISTTRWRWSASSVYCAVRVPGRERDRERARERMRARKPRGPEEGPLGKPKPQSWFELTSALLDTLARSF